MIYLAGPYTHPSSIIRLERFEALTKKAAELMQAGYVVYSPITHGHTIAMRHDLPLDFEWWKLQSLGMLRHASRLMILRIDGYHDSIGVKKEIELALSLGIEIEYIDQ
jgi:hypothetical protein